MNYKRLAAKIDDEELAARLLLIVDRPRLFGREEKEAYLREAADRLVEKRVFLATPAA